LERCSVCGLVYEKNAGDTWAFTIILDRLPLGLMIALVYFGVFRMHRTAGLLVFGGVILAFLWSTPYRWGVGIALHYLSRLYFPEPNDPIPP
jgi:hypothetical protein